MKKNRNRFGEVGIRQVRYQSRSMPNIEYYREKALSFPKRFVLDEFMRQLWSKKDMPELLSKPRFDIKNIYYP